MGAERADRGVVDIGGKRQIADALRLSEATGLGTDLDAADELTMALDSDQPRSFVRRGSRKRIETVT